MICSVEDLHKVYTIVMWLRELSFSMGCPFELSHLGCLVLNWEENRTSFVKEVLIFPVLIREKPLIGIRFHFILLNVNKNIVHILH